MKHICFLITLLAFTSLACANDCKQKFLELLQRASLQGEKSYQILLDDQHQEKKEFIINYLSDIVGNRLLLRTYVDEDGSTNIYRFRKCEVSENCVIFYDDFRDYPHLKMLNVTQERQLKLIWNIDTINKQLEYEVNETENILYVPKDLKTIRKDDEETIKKWLTGSTLHPYTVAGKDLIHARKAVGDPAIFWKESQEKAAKAVQMAHEANVDSLLVIGSTGLGKSAILLRNLSAVLKREQKLHFVIADKKDLVQQLFDDILDYKSRPGVADYSAQIWAGSSERTKDVLDLVQKAKERTMPTVVVTTIDSLKMLIGESTGAFKQGPKITPAQKRRNYEFLREVTGSVTFDEAHHAGAEQSENFINEMIFHKDARAFLFGVTATPIHTYIDIQGLFKNVFWSELDDINKFKEMLDKKKSINRPIEYVVDSNVTAVRKGELSPINIPYFLNADGTLVGESKKDLFIKSQDTGRYIVNPDPEVYEYVANLYLPFFKKHQYGFISGSSIDEIENLADYLNYFTRRNNLDRKFAYIHSAMTDEAQEKVKELLKIGKINFVLTVLKFDEGMNFPHLSLYGDVSRAIAPVQAIQRQGRVQRNFPGKISSDIVTMAEVNNDELQKNLAAIELLERQFNQNKGKTQTTRKRTIRTTNDQNEIWGELEKFQDLGRLRKLLVNGNYYAEHPIYKKLMDSRHKITKEHAMLMVDLLKFVENYRHLPYSDGAGQEEVKLSRKMRTLISRSPKKYNQLLRVSGSDIQERFSSLLLRQDIFGRDDRLIALLEQMAWSFAKLPIRKKSSQLGQLIQKLKSDLDELKKYISPELSDLLVKENLINIPRFTNEQGTEISENEKVLRVFGLDQRFDKALKRPVYDVIAESIKEDNGLWNYEYGPVQKLDTGLYNNFRNYITKFSPKILPFLNPGSDSQLVWDAIRNTRMFKNTHSDMALTLIEKNGMLDSNATQELNAIRILLFAEDFPKQDLITEYSLNDHDLLDNLIGHPKLDFATKINLFVIRYGRLPEKSESLHLERLLSYFLDTYMTLPASVAPEKQLLSRRVSYLLGHKQQYTKEQPLVFPEIKGEALEKLYSIYEVYRSYGILPLDKLSELSSLDNLRTTDRSLKKFVDNNRGHKFIDLLTTASGGAKYQILVDNFNYHAKLGVNPLADFVYENSQQELVYKPLRDLYFELKDKNIDYLNASFEKYLSYEASAIYYRWLNRIAGEKEELVEAVSKTSSRDQKLLENAKEYEKLMKDGFITVSTGTNWNMLYYIQNDDPTVVEQFIKSIDDNSIKRSVVFRREFSGKYPRLAYDLEQFVFEKGHFPTKTMLKYLDAEGKKDVQSFLRRLDGIQSDLGDKYETFLKMLSYRVRAHWKLSEYDIYSDVIYLRKSYQSFDLLSDREKRKISKMMSSDEISQYKNYILGKHVVEGNIAKNEANTPISDEVENLPESDTISENDIRKVLDHDSSHSVQALSEEKLQKGLLRIQNFLESHPNFKGYAESHRSDFNHAQWQSVLRFIDQINIKNVISEYSDKVSGEVIRFLGTFETFGKDGLEDIYKYEALIDQIIKDTHNRDETLESVNAAEKALLKKYNISIETLRGHLDKNAQFFFIVYQAELEFLEQKSISFFNIEKFIQKIADLSETYKINDTMIYSYLTKKSLDLLETYKSAPKNLATLLDAHFQNENLSVNSELFSQLDDYTKIIMRDSLNYIQDDKSRLMVNLLLEKVVLFEKKTIRQAIELYAFVMDNHFFPNSSDKGKGISLYQTLIRERKKLSVEWDYIFRNYLKEVAIFESNQRSLSKFRLGTPHPENIIYSIESHFEKTGELIQTAETNNFIENVLNIQNSTDREEILNLFTSDVKDLIISSSKQEYEQVVDNFSITHTGVEFSLITDDILKQLYINVKENADGSIRGNTSNRFKYFFESIFDPINGVIDFQGGTAQYQRVLKAVSSGHHDFLTVSNESWQEFTKTRTFKTFLSATISDFEKLLEMHQLSQINIVHPGDELSFVMDRFTTLILREPELVVESISPKVYSALMSTISSPVVKLTLSFYYNGALPKTISISRSNILLSGMIKDHLYIKGVLVRKVIEFISKYGLPIKNSDDEDEREVYELMIKLWGIENIRSYFPYQTRKLLETI